MENITQQISNFKIFAKIELIVELYLIRLTTSFFFQIVFACNPFAIKHLVNELTIKREKH